MGHVWQLQTEESKISRYFIVWCLVTIYVSPTYSEIEYFKSTPSSIRVQNTQYLDIYLSIEETTLFDKCDENQALNPFLVGLMASTLCCKLLHCCFIKILCLKKEVIEDRDFLNEISYSGFGLN